MSRPEKITAIDSNTIITEQITPGGVIRRTYSCGRLDGCDYLNYVDATIINECRSKCRRGDDELWCQGCSGELNTMTAFEVCESCFDYTLIGQELNGLTKEFLTEECTHTTDRYPLSDSQIIKVRHQISNEVTSTRNYISRLEEQIAKLRNKLDKPWILLEITEDEYWAIMSNDSSTEDTGGATGGAGGATA